MENTGSAFSQTAFNLFGYNTRSELESSKRYTGSYDPEPSSEDEVTAERRLYDYDNIGNRDDHTAGTGAPVYYCTDDLNRYKTLDGASACPPTSPDEEFTYDDDGNP